MPYHLIKLIINDVSSISQKNTVHKSMYMYQYVFNYNLFLHSSQFHLLTTSSETLVSPTPKKCFFTMYRKHCRITFLSCRISGANSCGEKKEICFNNFRFDHLATIWIYKQHILFSDLVLISPFQVKLTSLLLHSWSFPGWTI